MPSRKPSSPAPAAQATITPPTVDQRDRGQQGTLESDIQHLALQIQENTFFIHPGIEDKSSRNAVNVQFQPVLPLALTDDWNLITGRISSSSTQFRADPDGSHFIKRQVSETQSWRRFCRRARNWRDPGSLAPDLPSSFPPRLRQMSARKSGNSGPAGFWLLGEHYMSAYFRSSGSRWWKRSKQTSQMNVQYFAAYFLPHVGPLALHRTC